MQSLLKISVKKGAQGFGFILSNQSPCVVSSVIEGGPAEIATLKSGDEVLEVNGQNVSRSSHEKVVRLILKTSVDWVVLKVKRCCEQSEFQEESLEVEEDNNEFHNNIIETVDRVVEDMKSGSLYQSYEVPEIRKPSVANKSSKVSLMGRYESLGDNESPCLPYESPNSKSGNEGYRDTKNETGNSSPRKASVEQHLYPKSEIIKNSIFKVVVGYLRTIELPTGSNLPSASLNAINSVVGSLHLSSQKINQQLLMVVSFDGVRLVNIDGHTITTYPLKMLAFTCSCPEDSQYFGLVTRKFLNEDHRVTNVYDKNRFGKAQVNSCLIFMVDKEISEHAKHQNLAHKFGISCTRIMKIEACEEFPCVASEILHALDSLFKVRSRAGSFSDCSRGCPTPPMRGAIGLRPNKKDIMDDLSLIQRLKIKEELAAQQKAKDDSDLDSYLFERSVNGFDDALYIEEDVFRQDSVESGKKNSRNLASVSNLTIGDRASDRTALHGSLGELSRATMPVEQAELGLESLLRDPERCSSFEGFLKTQHSEENVMFWIACEKFKMLQDPCEVRKMAIEIYHTYLAQGAPALVNVDQQAVKKAEEKLISPDANMYKQQQQQIFMLMKYDCFPRYMKSEFYNACSAQDTQESAGEDADNKDNKKRKTHWYIQKSKGNLKEPVLKRPTEADRKRYLLGLLGKGKRNKDSKSKEKDQKRDTRREDGKLTDDSSSDSDGKAAPPDKEKGFPAAKSPVEMKDFLGCSSQFCRVIMPNGSSTVLSLESGKTICQLMLTYCNRQNLSLSADDVFVDEKNQPLEMEEDSLSFCDKVIYLLRKIQFRFDLPNKRPVAVREHPNKTLREVIEPIMHKNGYHMKDFGVRLAKVNQPVPLENNIGPLENKHLITVKDTGEGEAGNVLGKPPAGKGVKKTSKSTEKRVRRPSKDDSVLKDFSVPYSKTSKTQDAFNRFLRRGSLEGGTMFLKRKQAALKSLSSGSTDFHVFHGRVEKNDGLEKKGQRAKPTSKEKKHAKMDDRSVLESSDSESTMLKAQKENLLISQMNLGRFRPASEVVLRDSDFDDISGDDARISDDSHTTAVKERGRLPKRFRHSEIIMPSKELLASSKSKSLKVSAEGSSAKVVPVASSQRRLSKNLESWRARKNSCDSASSSATDELESTALKRSKKDEKHHSSLPIIQYCVSPTASKCKQKKVELPEPEVEILNSPVFPVSSLDQKGPKSRPMPIAGDELEFLRSLGSELGSFDVIDSPSVTSQAEEMEDSFDTAIRPMQMTVDEVLLSTSSLLAPAEEPIDVAKYEEAPSNSQGAASNNQESPSNNQEAPSSSQEAASNNEQAASHSEEVIATATGSVNDETLIMEDKETGFDLSGFMGMDTAKKRRRGRQKGGKETHKTDHAITFV